jgi:5-methylcytosine-specific restriction endonuclease McrA
VKGIQRAIYLRDRDRILARHRAHAEKHPEKFRERKRAYYQKNRTRLIAAVGERYHTREQVRAAHRESARRYTERNLDKVRASKRRFLEAHPEIWKNAKARRRGAPGRITAREWKAILLFYGNACASCKTPASISPLTIDHFIPIILGGPNTWDNAWPMCLTCNLKKGKSLPKIPAPPHVAVLTRTGTMN